VPASFRIAIVGSGPAGLSAAAHAKKLGLSHVLLEKAPHLADTIQKYQKKKLVMAMPPKLPLRADIPFAESKREEVLAGWERNTAEGKLNIMLDAEVVAIEGEKGGFTLRLADGRQVTAETVVLAIGTAGNPKPLGCEGDDLPHVQFQLDDAGAYLDEHITVIGAGDAGIENALGLAIEPAQANIVTILNRNRDFARAKAPNVSKLMEAQQEGRIAVMLETKPVKVEPRWLTVSTLNGEQRFRCDRVIARTGYDPPRAFLKGCGIRLSGEGSEAAAPAEKDASTYPVLSHHFESSRPGIYVIGALAGFPLIKHCINQGHDVVEFINGNLELEPADQPLLEKKFVGIPERRPVKEWLEILPKRIPILRELSPLQMREFMLDTGIGYYPAGKEVFRRNAAGSSLFAIFSGSVDVQISATDPTETVAIEAGSIFGEVGLISGRRRGATIVAREDMIAVEVPRMAALRLMARSPAAKKEVRRISTERQLLQLFGSGLTAADVKRVMATCKDITLSAGQEIVKEKDVGNSVFVIRNGSAVVEKMIGDRPVFLSYLTAGSYFGEMALLGGTLRTATVRAAVKSEVIELDGAAFMELLEAKPELLKKLTKTMATRKAANDFIEDQHQSFGSVVDMYSRTAQFLIDQGIGEATDLLLIDEKLCIGCDNCERACADSHEGLSRLNREAGKTFAHLHVPTSCRHCEHPHCMADCPPNAIHRGPDGEVFIDENCIGCGNCEKFCPYGVINMQKLPQKKPNLLLWLLGGLGPGPGEPPAAWIEAHPASKDKLAVKCDMCAGLDSGPACVRACPTGAAIRVAPEKFLTVARMAAR
jgi:cGMP-dependent protein kinase 2